MLNNAVQLTVLLHVLSSLEALRASLIVAGLVHLEHGIQNDGWAFAG